MGRVSLAGVPKGMSMHAVGCTENVLLCAFAHTNDHQFPLPPTGRQKWNLLGTKRMKMTARAQHLILAGAWEEVRMGTLVPSVISISPGSSISDPQLTLGEEV